MRSKKEIQTWLIDRVAKLSNISPEQVDIEVHFDRYGMESSDAVAIIADLEEWLPCEIEDPTIMYEYPSIIELAQYLADTYAI